MLLEIILYGLLCGSLSTLAEETNCQPPEWQRKKGMTKGFHAEPTGNTVNMNCRIRQNKDQPDLYPSSEYQVRWYWKQSIACCSEDTKPPNVSDFQNEKNETFNITDFGILLDPNSTEKSINKKFGIRKGSYGQKVLLKQVSPNKTNGYYTCIFITACGSLIGHTMFVEANNRQISLPNIVPPQNTCCSTWSAEKCTRDVTVKTKFTITCAVTSGTPTELKWSVWNSTLNDWEKFDPTRVSEKDSSETSLERSEDMTGCVPYTGVNINYENTLEIYHVDISTNNTQYKCIATNAKGQDEYVWQVRVAPEVMEAQVMIGMIAAIVIVVGIVAYAAYKFSSHHKKNSGLKIYEHREVPMDLCSWNNQGDHSRADFFPLLHQSNGTSGNGEIERLLAEFPQSVQLERTSIVLHEMIGTGQFGVVYRAEIDDGMGKIKQVAIKANKNETNLDDNNKNTKVLVNEFKTMWDYGRHENLVGLEGICASHKPYWLVMEYCAKGNLRDFLRLQRPKENEPIREHCIEGTESNYDRILSIVDLISMVRQISLGMRYLEEKCCIHRDLAARNILVTQSLSMKISDFGLARNVEDTDYYTMQMTSQKQASKGLMPWRWMSIETHEARVFTTASDVWSFGILMWEIFTFGMIPYMTMENDEILKFLEKGKRLEKPRHASAELYQVMVDCWSKCPSDRPSFRIISEDAEKMLLDKGIGDIYFDVTKDQEI